MGFHEIPSGERIHIGFLGRTNVGKSSVLNAVIGQELSVVSDIKGTTTDPVKKSMELLPIGAVVLIDTPGIDDTGTLGEMRIEKTRQILSKIHIAVLVADACRGMTEAEHKLLKEIKDRKIPYLIAYNKCDLLWEKKAEEKDSIYISAKTNENISLLKEKLGKLVKSQETEKYLIRDLLNLGDSVVLVVPIDKSAPKGRLILPQQQTIRDILEAGAMVTVCRDSELEETLTMMKQKPRLVITDSQVFDKVNSIVPKDILLTSFSILFARYKGDLPVTIAGAKAINLLQDGDKVLISEGCTHHRQCGDIGRDKLPNWIEQYTGKKLNFFFTSGGEFPQDLSEYALVVHCGGCMLNEKEMQHRIRTAVGTQISITNYGIAIAYMNGILKRSGSFSGNRVVVIRDWFLI